jgi:hypothetical protein
MNLQNVMEQIAARAATIAELQQVNDRPVDSISPPTAMVAWPELVQYDVTYARGCDRITLPFLVIVGRSNDRAARDQMARHVDGSGPASVKQVLEADPAYAGFTCRVTQVEFDVITQNGVDYLGADFTLDIVGDGAP